MMPCTEPDEHCDGCDSRGSSICRFQRSIKRERIRVYNAGPWFCKEERQAIDMAFWVLSANKALDVYSPLHSHPLNVKAYADLPIDSPRAMYHARNAARTPAERQIVFYEDVKQIALCDVITAQIENWDPGTIFELGLAYMARYENFKERIDLPAIIAWSYNPIRQVNLMIAQAADAFTTDVKELPNLIMENVHAERVTR